MLLQGKVVGAAVVVDDCMVGLAKHLPMGL